MRVAERDSLSTVASSVPVLEVDDVTVDFGAVKAVSNISLQLRPRQVLGLIGPNGAGKTTLVNCISGFIRPTAGAIRFGDVSHRHWSPEQARKQGVARTFQGGRLFADLSVHDNVIVAGVALGIAYDDAAAQALELLQWSGYRGDVDRKAGAVPYVDERRIGIARALIGSPSYVLLDEPAAGMSDSEATELADLIEGIVSRIGCGVLLIEHNMSLISRVCDWAFVMNSGIELASGVPQEVFAHKEVISAYLGEEA